MSDILLRWIRRKIKIVCLTQWNVVNPTNYAHSLTETRMNCFSLTPFLPQSSAFSLLCLPFVFAFIFVFPLLRILRIQPYVFLTFSLVFNPLLLTSRSYNLPFLSFDDSLQMLFMRNPSSPAYSAYTKPKDTLNMSRWISLSLSSIFHKD